MSTKTAPTRPAMTPDDAKTFAGTSLASCMQIYQAVADRKAEGVHTECECEPYEDIFTFGRWRALGQAVKKGEKALRIVSFAKGKSRTDQEGNEVEGRLFPTSLCLFCRCQTQPIEPKKEGHKN